MSVTTQDDPPLPTCWKPTDSEREARMASAAAARRQFRSKSVASSDPRSPYYTSQRVRPHGGRLARSPSVACVPQYDSGCAELPERNLLQDCQRRRSEHPDQNGDIPGLNLTLSPDDPKAATIRQHYYPEGGWGWVVAVCALTIHVLASALHMAVGLFVLEVQKQFPKEQGALEAVILGALSTTVALFLSPVVVALCRKKSTRLTAVLGGLVSALGCLFTSFATQLHQLYLSYGFFVGSGVALARETAAIMVGQYFKKRRELVEMVIMCGTGVGMALVPLLVSHWLRSLGWRRGLQLIAGLQSVSCLVAVLYRPASLYHPQRRAILHIKSLQKRSKAKDKMPALEKHPFFDFSVLKSRTVQVLMMGTGITAFGITSPLVLLMHQAQQDQLDFKSLYQLQVFLGLATSTGAVAFGLIVVKNSAQCMIAKQYLCQAASFMVSGWLLAFPTLHGFHGYVLFVWIYGIFYGGYMYSLKLCVFEKVRARNFSRAWGFVQWCQAIPGVIGIPLTGYINQLFGDRRGFYFSSALVLLGTSALFFIDVHKRKIKRKKLDELRRCSDVQFQQAQRIRRQSQDSVFGPMVPRAYGDLRKAQELTCISEEVLMDNFLEDYVDDCITSCNKEEKFLMLSEFENNLFKTEENLDSDSIPVRKVSIVSTMRGDPCPSCHHCASCSRGCEDRECLEARPSLRQMARAVCSVDVIEEVTTSL